MGSGSTIAWKFYLDFLHGGYNYHPTLYKEGVPLPLVLDDQKGQADAASAAPHQPQVTPGAAGDQAMPI